MVRSGEGRGDGSGEGCAEGSGEGRMLRFSVGARLLKPLSPKDSFCKSERSWELSRLLCLVGCS